MNTKFSHLFRNF